MSTILIRIKVVISTALRISHNIRSLSSSSFYKSNYPFAEPPRVVVSIFPTIHVFSSSASSGFDSHAFFDAFSRSTKWSASPCLLVTTAFICKGNCYFFLFLSQTRCVDKYSSGSVLGREFTSTRTFRYMRIMKRASH